MKLALEIAEKMGLDLDEHNLVKDLGKFEREHVGTLYFFDAYMNGCGEHGDNVTTFVVDKDDVEEIPDYDRDDIGKRFHLEFLNSGFVCGVLEEEE